MLLTPEEEVRQKLLDYLIFEQNISKNLITVETGLRYNKLNKRTDILIYSRLGQPWMLVECKAAGVKIASDTLRQISIYNTTIKAPYLLIANGQKMFLFRKKENAETYEQISTFPEYPA
ncbi:MAG: type I restriction enzyme HsdR N-terminal domain-containing protein [Leadbetterella sp.]